MTNEKMSIVQSGESFEIHEFGRPIKTPAGNAISHASRKVLELVLSENEFIVEKASHYSFLCTEIDFMQSNRLSDALTTFLEKWAEGEIHLDIERDVLTDGMDIHYSKVKKILAPFFSLSERSCPLTKGDSKGRWEITAHMQKIYSTMSPSQRAILENARTRSMVFLPSLLFASERISLEKYLRLCLIRLDNLQFPIPFPLDFGESAIKMKEYLKASRRPKAQQFRKA